MTVQAATAPVVPEQGQPQNQIGFAPVPGGSGIVSPGQAHGWVQKPAEGGTATNTPAEGNATAEQPQQPDMSTIVSMLQAALAPKEGAQPEPTAQVPAEAPQWLQGGVNGFDVSSIQDPILKSMATAMQVAGADLDLDRVLGKALATGDVTMIDHAYLFEKGGAQSAQLAEIAKGIVQAVAAKSEAITKEVHNIAGGEAGWDASVAAFNQSAPHALKLTVSQMLNSTDESFIKAGAQIVHEFGKSSGLLPVQGAARVQATAGAGQSQGLSKEQFQEELLKLNPQSRTYQQDREALYTRRALGKRAGV